MSNFSTTQPDLFGDSYGEFAPNRPSNSGRTSGASEIFGGDFPAFGNYATAGAQTTRMASRLLAAGTTEEEHQALLAERQTLLDRFVDETITRRESIRLEYVRWLLDRIEDAKYGQDLDVIEDHISRYEKFLEDIEDFKEALQRSSKKRR